MPSGKAKCASLGAGGTVTSQRVWCSIELSVTRLKPYCAKNLRRATVAVMPTSEVTITLDLVCGGSACDWSPDHQSPREQLREYNDRSSDVLRVLHVIPQKSRTFSKASRFSPFMQFYCELLRSPVNALFKHFSQDSKGCVSLGTTLNRWLKRPTPNASRRCPPTSEVIRQVEEWGVFFPARARR
jgi:hypothetical protein